MTNKINAFFVIISILKCFHHYTSTRYKVYWCASVCPPKSRSFHIDLLQSVVWFQFVWTDCFSLGKAFQSNRIAAGLSLLIAGRYIVVKLLLSTRVLQSEPQLAFTFDFPETLVVLITLSYLFYTYLQTTRFTFFYQKFSKYVEINSSSNQDQSKKNDFGGELTISPWLRKKRKQHFTCVFLKSSSSNWEFVTLTLENVDEYDKKDYLLWNYFRVNCCVSPEHFNWKTRNLSC